MIIKPLERTITVRGAKYRVRELSAKETRQWQQVGKESSIAGSAYIASVACVDPDLGDEAACLELPQLIVDRIAVAVLKLTGEDESAAPKAAAASESSQGSSSSSTDSPLSLAVQ